MVNESNKKIFEMLGDGCLFSSIQFSIGSVIMSSKFSILNFSTDQKTLQNGADALMEYIKISILWTLGVVMLMYSKFGLAGGITGLILNGAIIAWIYYSYVNAFRICTVKNNLHMPKLHIFTPSHDY